MSMIDFIGEGNEMLDTRKGTAPAWAPLIALLTCPFCGSDADSRERNGTYSIACVNKGHTCMIGPCTQMFSTLEGAAFAWNLRIGEVEPVTRSEEPVCVSC